MLNIHEMKNPTVLRIYTIRDRINLSPEYQRGSDVWNTEKKQLLIDSLLNDFDIPKIYFHARDDMNQAYSVIDGRQRLEAIWGFLSNKFPLNEDFKYLRDPGLMLKGLYYSEIANKHPLTKIDLDAVVLPIMLISTGTENETEATDLIEDMFSRLNDGAPLNAAEKRNAFTGPIVSSIRKLVQHDFFINSLRVANTRYRHHELVARLLFTEYSLVTHKKLFDTKKVYLDKFVKTDINDIDLTNIEERVREILNYMSYSFEEKDFLLRASGNVVLYYLLFRKRASPLDRVLFDTFRSKLKVNKEKAEKDEADISYDLLEFERLTQQGTNDASNLRERFRIMALDFGLISNSFDSELL